MENAGQGQIGWPREETVPERDWKPGMVLRSYVCERCNPVRGGTPFVHELRHNCWVYAKPRLVVVVIKCHFFAVVPLFTLIWDAASEENLIGSSFRSEIIALQHSLT